MVGNTKEAVVEAGGCPSRGGSQPCPTLDEVLGVVALAAWNTEVTPTTLDRIAGYITSYWHRIEASQR